MKDNQNVKHYDLKDNKKLKNITVPSPLFKEIDSQNYETVEKDYISVVCLSDTHIQHKGMKQLPKADILLHSGDFTFTGQPGEIQLFCQYLAQQTHIKYKVVVAGNHEYSLDYPSFILMWGEEHTQDQHQAFKAKIVSTLSQHCIYLENTGIHLLGLNIYGCPYNKRFGSCINAFQKPLDSLIKEEDQLLTEYEQIPSETDLLLTHQPPLSLQDRVEHHGHQGSASLLHQVTTRIQPLLHQYGHLHGDFGLLQHHHSLYLNASNCDEDYRTGTQGPVLIKIPKKSSQSTTVIVTFI